MAKAMCEAGKKKRKERLSENNRYSCKSCGVKVKKKDWVCKPSKI